MLRSLAFPGILLYNREECHVLCCPPKQFHTLPGILHSHAALPNSYPNASVPFKEAVCTDFILVFGMTLSGVNP